MQQNGQCQKNILTFTKVTFNRTLTQYINQIKRFCTQISTTASYIHVNLEGEVVDVSPSVNLYPDKTLHYLLYHLQELFGRFVFFAEGEIHS